MNLGYESITAVLIGAEAEGPKSRVTEAIRTSSIVVACVCSCSDLLKSTQVLYVQALVAGGHKWHKRTIGIFNKG